MVATLTGGERIDVRCDVSWLEPALRPVLDAGVAEAPDQDVSLSVRVESVRSAFPIEGRRLVTRGVWSDGSSVLIENACSSGFDLRVDTVDRAPSGMVNVTARYRPAARTHAANTVLRQRFTLLARQTLVHYPVIWRAGLRGHVPLHVSAFTSARDADGGGALLIGPGGVGKSTLLQAETAVGARPTSDNLCIWGGGRAYGIVEPLRVEGGAGRRATHGRREQPLPGRLPSVRPERLILLRRGDRPAVRRLAPQAAARALVAGTYSAGELRRYWSFAAVLALGTGLGPAHPPIDAVGRDLTDALPCVEVCLGARPGHSLTAVLDQFEGVP